MPLQRNVIISGPSGQLEGVLHLSEACPEQGRRAAPQAIAVAARPPNLPTVVLPGAGHFFHGCLHQIKQLVLHNFDGQPL